MDTKLFRVSGNDIVHGAVNAIIAALVVGLYGVVTTAGFDLFTADWSAIGKSALNWAFAGFIGSVGKKLLTDADGKLGGVVKV